MKCGRMLVGVAAVVLLIIVASCSKDSSSDVRELLATVPSDASLVGAGNAGELLKKAGCDVSGDKAELTPEMEALIGDAKKSGIEVPDGIFSGEAGVELGAMVFFVEGKNVYLTGNLSDADKFVTYCEGKTNGKFSENDDVRTLNNIAVKGSRFWLSGDSSVDVKEIVRFAALSEEQSFLSNTLSGELAKTENDIVVWGNIDGLANLGMGMGNLGMARIVLSSVVENAQDFLLTAKFEKGKGTSEFRIFDGKGKEAKFLLPMGKIDTSTVKKLGEKGSVVVAIDINKKFVAKIKELVQTFGGDIPSLYNSIIEPLDGTACAALSPDMQEGRVIVTTTGDKTAALKGVLNSVGNVTTDGKLLIATKGEPTGDIEISKAADELSGAMMGVVAAPSNDMGKYMGVSFKADVFKYSTFTLVPDGGGLKFCSKTVMKNDSENVLQTMVKAMADSGRN